jgi:hypothetical protein
MAGITSLRCQLPCCGRIISLRAVGHGSLCCAGLRRLGVVLVVAALLDWHPGQFAPLGSELVAAARQLRRALCIGGSQGRSSPVRISAPPAA